MCLRTVCLQAHPVKDMLERIDRGASKKFILELVEAVVFQTVCPE